MKRAIVACVAIFGVAFGNAHAAEERLLEPFGASFTAPYKSEFVAKQEFVVNTSENARVRIAWLGDSFQEVVLPKTERSIPATELRLSKLKRTLPESSIITELGDKAETRLYHFYETLAYKQAAHDYTWIIGYVRNVDGVIWAVDAFWHGDGWRVDADSVESPYGWYAGSEFVSR